MPELASKYNVNPKIISKWKSEAVKNLQGVFDIQINMDGKGRAYDNIMIERFWRTLKYEEIYLNSYDTVKEAVFGIIITISQIVRLMIKHQMKFTRKRNLC